MELFARPVYLLYFVPAAALTALVFWAGRKLKERAVNALFGRAAYAKLTAHLRPVSAWRTALFFLAEFFLFAALAGPQWGTEIIEAQGAFAQTVIAVDVSASMRARDLRPDRLDNAKNMLRMLVNNLKEERVGIIAFTSQAFIQCPITTDDDALQYFISALRPDMLPVNGTSLAAPVSLAAKMLAKYPGQKALILLTDGEDHLPKDLETAQQTAAKYGVRVIAIGIGTKEGTLIPARTDAEGNVSEYKKDKQGNTVVSKLDEKPLVELAQATGGVYISYTSPAQVAARVEESLRGLDKTLSSAIKRAAYKNRYQIPLLLALLCLAAYLLWPRGHKPQSGEKNA
ncbi:MAG: VWA domain-containing protein [Elusimicrobiaceae bacterium]|nr:VWA domain-containing protein [Elusimicrobiaceae bacterium]